MDVFSPYRPQTPYAPGYGMYPTRPGSYMNGLGDIVMQPYRPSSPYGSWGYGIYGLGENGDTVPPPPAVHTTSSGIPGLDSPVITGLVGIVAGAALGYFIWGR